MILYRGRYLIKRMRQCFGGKLLQTRLRAVKKKQISFLCNTMTFVASKIEYGAIADEVQLSELQRDALL